MGNTTTDSMRASGLCFTYNIEAPAGSRVTSAVRQAPDGSCTSWSLLGAPLGVNAHGDEAHLELNTTQAGPGVSVDLRGVGFDPESAITIMLVGAQRQLLLGTVSSGETGDFTQALSLPVDLLPGAYEVRAADSHHSASIPLNITPSAGAEQEGGQRSEDEPLLAPMPEHSADAASAKLAGSPIAAPPRAVTTPMLPPALLSLSGLALIMLVVALVVISRHSQR